MLEKQIELVKNKRTGRWRSKMEVRNETKEMIVKAAKEAGVSLVLGANRVITIGMGGIAAVCSLIVLGSNKLASKVSGETKVEKREETE